MLRWRQEKSIFLLHWFQSVPNRNLMGPEETQGFNFRRDFRILVRALIDLFNSSVVSITLGMGQKLQEFQLKDLTGEGFRLIRLGLGFLLVTLIHAARDHKLISDCGCQNWFD